MSQAVNENPTIEEQTWWYGKGLAVRKDHAAYLREWAAAIRKNSGSSVDADQLDSTAVHIEGLEAALAPFAAYAERFPKVGGTFPETGTLYSLGIRGRPGWIGLNVEDFNAALAALARADLPKPQEG